MLTLAIGRIAARRSLPTPQTQKPGSPLSEWQLARRSLPTTAVFTSMLATELSATTFPGVPQASFGGDWRYRQLAVGALLGKLVLAQWVIPLYHRLRVVTVYGFLQQRFGPRSRRAAATCFLLGRLLASGARLFIAALAVSTVTGWPVEAAM